MPDEVRVATFVGNAWDPRDGIENPWIDVARQIAGERGVDALGATARTSPPGTRALGDVFAAAEAPVLVLFDEVLNFINRHGNMADHFYAFLQNLTVAVAGTTHAAAVVSLPRSQTEMTESDLEWQERITKVVNRVAQDLIANDESEISEVVRRRLFENLGSERTRQAGCQHVRRLVLREVQPAPGRVDHRGHGDEREPGQGVPQAEVRSLLPVPSSHPVGLPAEVERPAPVPEDQGLPGHAGPVDLLSVQSEQFQGGSAPNHSSPLGPRHWIFPSFRETVLAQLGEKRLITAIDADIAGQNARVKPLDVDTKGALKDIHRRVGTAMLFESSGGMVEKVAHLPELRFALGEPDVDTATIDSAASALEQTGFFVRKTGSGRLPDPPPSDPQEGGRRPPGLTG